jgi:hypothetical protein
MEKTELLTTLVERAIERDAELQAVIAAETEDAKIYALHEVGRALASLKAVSEIALATDV